jgi:hypothetical protein
MCVCVYFFDVCRYGSFGVENDRGYMCIGLYAILCNIVMNFVIFPFILSLGVIATRNIEETSGDGDLEVGSERMPRDSKNNMNNADSSSEKVKSFERVSSSRSLVPTSVPVAAGGAPTNNLPTSPRSGTGAGAQKAYLPVALLG